MENLVEMPAPPRTLGVLPVAGQREFRRIGLLLFDGCSLLTAGIIAEAFRVANELELQRHRRPVYQLCLLSYRGGNVACSSSVRIYTQGLDALGQRGFNAIFIACSEREPAGERDARLLSAMMEVSTSVLERCGHGRALLAPRVSRARSAHAPMTFDGSEAPASVFWCREAADNAPEVMASAIDMALAQIETDLGSDMARDVARQLRLEPTPTAVPDPRPDTRGESRPLPHSTLHNAAPEDLDDVLDTPAATAEKIHASARWISEHYMEAISVADAARFAAMSERNYLRRFKYTIGMTPSEYLLKARLEMSCQLLMRTSLPVDKIARRCGMGNGDRLGKIFRKRYAVSPTEFRHQGQPGAGPSTPLLEEC